MSSSFPAGDSPGEDPAVQAGTSPARERSPAVYWVLVAVLFAGATLLRAFPFEDNEARHVIWEFISTTLALIVGALALVRFYSKKQETFLFIGTGFLGTGLLNAYHAVMASVLVGGGATGLQTPDGAGWAACAPRRSGRLPREISWRTSVFEPS